MSAVAIVGLGTIGSALAPLVARNAAISRVVLIDYDEYEAGNLPSQTIGPAAPGRAKVDVQAEAMRAVNPELAVEAVRSRVENVPLGTFLDCAVLLACVDNRRARQTVNRLAWRCGSAWIDAAVGEPKLARVATYCAVPNAACLECGWDHASYDLLEQEYPCATDASGTFGHAPATNAAVELGTLAAALQAGMLRAQLADAAAGRPSAASSGAQVVLDADSYVMHRVRLARNAACRFDHEVLDIEPIAIDAHHDTLGDLFAAAAPDSEGAIALEGHSFTTRLDCPACGATKRLPLSVAERAEREVRACACGSAMRALGFFGRDRLSRASLAAADLARPVAAIGLRARDVITVMSAGSVRRHLSIEERAI
jgi:molybdopterin/thiamine biosynthesis adenylyltransferase